MILKPRLIFLSTMAFNANISIIKRLREKYDVYYIGMYSFGKQQSFGCIKSTNNIVCFSQIQGFSKYANFVDLDKSFLVRKYKGFSLSRLSFEFKLHQFINRLHGEVFLCDASNPAFFIDRFLNRNKLASIIHDPFLHSSEMTFKRKLANSLLIKLAKHYILFNSAQKDEFIKFYQLNQKNVFCSFLSQYEYNSLFTPINICPPSKRFRMFFFGRITGYKGVDILLDAFDKYLKRSSNHDIELVIAGKGDINYKNIKSLGNNVVIFNRFMEEGEILSILQNTDLVVCPYIDATQSGVIMTAYALKVPVLATTVGGLPEALEHGKLGYLVPPKDSDALCKAIVDISTNPTLLDTYKKNIEKTYFNNGPKSWEKATSIIEKALDFE